MGKLMRVTVGSAFLVAVPAASGVLSDHAELQCKCTGLYNKAVESGIRWNDERIGVEWPIRQPILSGKDQEAQTLDQWLESPDSDNFSYPG